jgi:hypothetical protein
MSSGKISDPASLPVAQWQRIQELMGQVGLPEFKRGRVLGLFRPLQRTAEELEALLRQTVQVHYRGELPHQTLGGARSLLLSGSVDGATFTVQVYDMLTDPDDEASARERVAEFDLQREAQGTSVQIGGVSPDAAFQFCDRVMGQDPELFAAYVAHRLGRARGKRGAKLVALLSTVVADKLRDELE